MDNLPAQKATKVREVIAAVRVRGVFLSPYSPDLNQARKFVKTQEYLRSQKSRPN
jgi:transposase